MFPSYSIEIEENISDDKAAIGKSFLFDFNKGDFVIKDGKLQVVEGIESLKVWIEKILKTEKFKFKIYKTGQENEYGATLLELVNSRYPKSFIESEIQREVTEALIKNSQILAINDFEFNRGKRLLTVNFTVSSIYGITREEVIL